MSIPREPEPVKLITGIMYRSDTALDETIGILTDAWGPVDSRLQPYEFSYTDYYKKEMGVGLWKCFVSFLDLQQVSALPSLKLFSNELEARFVVSGSRQVNIDPGYITAAKLVLATGKDFAHRIFLEQKIYGDVHLTFQRDAFLPNPWTYPDYRQAHVLQYFTDVRQTFMDQLHDGLKPVAQPDTR